MQMFLAITSLILFGKQFNFSVPWNSTFKEVLIMKPQNQLSLAHSIKTISEQEKADALLKNRNDLKI